MPRREREELELMLAAMTAGFRAAPDLIDSDPKEAKELIAMMSDAWDGTARLLLMLRESFDSIPARIASSSELLEAGMERILDEAIQQTANVVLGALQEGIENAVAANASPGPSDPPAGPENAAERPADPEPS